MSRNQREQQRAQLQMKEYQLKQVYKCMTSCDTPLLIWQFFYLLIIINAYCCDSWSRSWKSVSAKHASGPVKRVVE